MCRCTSVEDKLRRLACAVTIAVALSSCTKAQLIGRELAALKDAASSFQNTPPLPVLTLDSTTVTVAEGSVATFTVTLSEPSDQTVTVDYATVNGTAKAARDFTAATGTLTFNPGDTTQTLTVTTLANSLYSNPLTYQVQLSNPAHATVSSPGTGSITNTDPMPTVSFFNATNFEGCNTIFVARLSTLSLADTDITWSTANGTATSGTDFTSVSTTTTIPAGTLEVGLSVPLLDDGGLSVDKTFTATISAVTGATVSGGSTVTGTIKDKLTTIASFTQINRNPAGTLTLNYEWMSPDGCYILYSATQDSAMSEFFTASPFGTSQLKISHPFPTGADGSGIAASITPDSKRIVYIADQETKQIPELYSVKPDGTDWMKLSPTLDATSKGVGIGYYKMSGDGTKFAYKVDAGGGSSYELYIANIDGTQNRKVNDPFTSGGCVQDIPEFTADSSMIGYYGDTITKDTNDLYVNATDGSGSNIKLTSSFPSGATGVTAFDFTPDGQKLVFLADIDTVGITELYAVNIDGSNLTKLNAALGTDVYVNQYTISHDSQKVSYITYDPNSGIPNSIYAVHIDGTSHATLHTGAFNIWFGGFTPDDSRVVHAGNYGNTVVRSNTLDGTNELAIGSYAGWGNMNVDINKILSDGRVLYSSLGTSGMSFIWSEFIVPADGGSTPTRLTSVVSSLNPEVYVDPSESKMLVYYPSSIDKLPCASVNLNGTGYTTLSPAGKYCELDDVNWTKKIALFYGDIAGAGKSNLYVKSVP